MKRPRCSASSSAAGSSRSSVGVVCVTSCSRRSCASVMATATSFCWPRDSTSRAARPSRRTPTSARCGPTCVMCRAASRVARGRERLGQAHGRRASRGGSGAARRRPLSAATVSCQYGSSCSMKRPRESRDHLAQARQLGVPRGGLVRLALERRVALLQGSGVAQPGIDERRFHVEHRPVHPAAPAAGPLLDQPVDARIDDLDREGLGELREGLDMRPATRAVVAALRQHLEANGEVRLPGAPRYAQ